MEHIQRVRRLYKTILKLHRGLPEDLKIIGNSYVKDEFKRHKKCNPAETTVFMEEWTVSNKPTEHEHETKNTRRTRTNDKKKSGPVQVINFRYFSFQKYAVLLSEQLGLKGPISAQKLGKQLSKEELDNMSDEQIQQLYELMLAAQGNVKEEIK